MKITLSQNARLHKLLMQTNLFEQKAELVKRFSHKSYTSSKELLYNEATNLINFLEEQNESLSKMRKKMLHYGYLMGYDQPNTPEQKEMPPARICLMNVSAWCQSKKCKNPKPINEYNSIELTEVVSQFEKVYKSFNQQLIKDGRKQQQRKQTKEG